VTIQSINNDNVVIFRTRQTTDTTTNLNGSFTYDQQNNITQENTAFAASAVVADVALPAYLYFCVGLRTYNLFAIKRTSEHDGA
jgi:hypothetical protein